MPNPPQGIQPIKTLQDLPDQGGPMPASYATPGQITAMRDYIKALEGHRFQTVANPWQGWSNMANALAGGLVSAAANQRQIESERYRRSLDPYPPGTMATPQTAPPAGGQPQPTEGTPVALGFSGAAPGDSSGGDPRGKIPLIRATAQRYGIDPDVAVKVAKSEGLGDFTGDKGTSFGAYQLHIGGGLGDNFYRDTGLDPRDPKNENATIDYALRHAASSGWSAFHGAANTGIGPMAGIGGGGTQALAFSGQPADQIYAGVQPQ